MPLKKVYEWKSNKFIEIKPLNSGRSSCSSVFVPLNIENDEGVLVVAGGAGDGTETMEYLTIPSDDSLIVHDWRVCRDKLPHRLHNSQMHILKNKLILNGNNDASGKIEVWVGNISFETELRVKWTPLPQMIEERRCHISVCIDDKIFCIGGISKRSTEYFSFKNFSWQKGPDLPFWFYGARGVVNQSTNQCFIVGGCQDVEEASTVYLFDPKKGLIDIQGDSDFPSIFDHIAVWL